MIQRPESHNIHHGGDIHRYNHADLLLMDILFGTFKNPKSVDGVQCGFSSGASSRILEMLVGLDVYEPRQPGRDTLIGVSKQDTA